MKNAQPILYLGRDQKLASSWAQVATDCGWQARCFPLIEICPLNWLPSTQDSTNFFSAFTWIFLTSANAARMLLQSRPPSPWPADVKMAVVGERTAAPLRAAGIPVTLTASRQTGSSLAQDFLATCKDPQQEKLLWLSARQALRDMAQRLQAAGCTLRRVDVYETRPLPGPPLPDYSTILLYSPSAVRALLQRGGDPSLYRIWSLGPSTSRAARSAGLVVDHELQRPHPSALADHLMHLRTCSL